MFNFFKEPDKKKVIEMSPIRSRVARDEEIKTAYVIVNNAFDDDSLDKVFSQYDYNDKTNQDDINSTSEALYNIFYKVEQLVREREIANLKDFEDRLKSLEAEKKAAAKGAGTSALDEKIAQLNEEHSKNVAFENQRRRAIYDAYFKHLHQIHGDNEEEINRIKANITRYTRGTHDDAHNRFLNSMYAYGIAREKNEAYGNTWYMIAAGVIVMLLGATLLTVSLVTGFAAPFVFVFGSMALGGLFMTFLSGKKSAEDLLSSRVSDDAEKFLNSAERIAASKKLQKSQSNSFGALTWQNAPLYLLGITGAVLLLVDAFLGGPLSVMGASITPAFIPSYTLSVDMGTRGFNFYILEFTVNMLGTMISSSSLNYALNMAILFAATSILSYATSFSKNKTYMRAHKEIKEFSAIIKWTYGICGGCSMLFGYNSIEAFRNLSVVNPFTLGSIFSLPMFLIMGSAGIFIYTAYQYLINGKSEVEIWRIPFKFDSVKMLLVTAATMIICASFITFNLGSLLSIPMFGLLAGVGGFSYCAYKHFIKGEPNIVIPGQPAISCTKGMLYSAAAILACSLSLFVFVSNPIVFSVLILVGAGIYTLAKDQITASAETRNAKVNKEAMIVEMKNVASPGFKPLASPATQSAATSRPFLSRYYDEDGNRAVSTKSKNNSPS